MKPIDPRNTLPYRAATATLIAACGLTLYVGSAAAKPQQSEETTTTPTPVIVHPKYGGQLLGYDIDRNGTEGLLSEYVAESSNGKSRVATEIFDQKTGAITHVAAEENHTLNDYIVQYINADDLGLVLFQESGQNNFLTLNPFTANKFTGVWTPPIMSGYGLSQVSVAQGDEVVGFAMNPVASLSYVFGSNVSDNSFGPPISLASIISVDEFLVDPVIALDTATNQAVLADSHDCPEPGPQCATSIALVNLTTGAITEFTDKLGVGQVNGLAVDPVKGIAVTTTLVDQGVEFYHLATQKGFKRIIPGAASETDAGLDVEFDPIHKLFLVSQYSSTGNPDDPQPRVYVYNEDGEVIETITTLSRIPITPNRMVLNTTTRTGFLPLIVEPENLPLQLESFTY